MPRLFSSFLFTIFLLSGAAVASMNPCSAGALVYTENEVGTFLCTCPSSLTCPTEMGTFVRNAAPASLTVNARTTMTWVYQGTCNAPEPKEQLSLEAEAEMVGGIPGSPCPPGTRACPVGLFNLEYECGKVSLAATTLAYAVQHVWKEYVKSIPVCKDTDWTKGHVCERELHRALRAKAVPSQHLARDFFADFVSLWGISGHY
ncbi:hypothetical protein K438DRAFT_1770535 [Mycena galopus ATCC 62051]|nr:hypothetical protein K438DRAFT_1770535 [Mycena galopus ATCC 62051]